MAALLAGPLTAALFVYGMGSFTASTMDTTMWTGGSRAIAMVIWVALSIFFDIFTLALLDAAFKTHDEKIKADLDALAAKLRARSAPDIRQSADGGRRVEL